MPNETPCEICGTLAETDARGHMASFKCPRCQRYTLTDSAASMLSPFTKQQRDVSAWIYEQNAMGSTPSITSDYIAVLREIKPPSLADRATKLLVALAKQSSQYGHRFRLNEPWLLAASYSGDIEQLTFVARVLLERTFVSILIGNFIEVTTRGYIDAEERLRVRSQGIQGFVAMSFALEMSPIFVHGFAKGIREAGFEPLRIDRVEHLGKIDDEIIAQVRRSRFVVADFTGHRGGVYFEAGFAHGLNLPVIYTCRKSDMPGLHFDVRQFNTIDWEDAAELAQRLANRIAAVIGDGPNQPPRT
jgi:hypothetical protein